MKDKVKKMARVQELTHTEELSGVKVTVSEAEAKAKGQSNTREESGLLAVWS